MMEDAPIILKEIEEILKSTIKIPTNTGSHILLFNPEITLEYDDEGYITKIVATGIDETGKTRVFEKTMEYEVKNGSKLLKKISAWKEKTD